MAKRGQIVAGALAPHPPHLVYGENPPQNEPKSKGGWEVLRRGYEKLRKNLEKINYDTLVVLSPHWRTNVGTHFVGVKNLKSISVDPIFPNIFRYHYDAKFDVELAEEICDRANKKKLVGKMMRNKDYRVDYGTITSCHMVNPKWNKPLVSISSFGAAQYYNLEVMQTYFMKLGEATREAIEASGKRCVLLSSNSLSHRHFTIEPNPPEDMSQEHITHHGQYLWDMKMLELMRRGKTKEMIDILPDFTEQTMAETDCGALTWMMSAMGYPTYPAKVHGYGTVIGTGNAVVEWNALEARP